MIYDCCFRFIQTYDRHRNCYSFDNIGLVKQQDILGEQMFQLFHKWLFSQDACQVVDIMVSSSLFTCADPEFFVRGCPILTTFSFLLG